MENQVTANNRVITLKDLWHIFLERWWIILLAALLGMGSFFGFSMITYQPQYESTATLYILRQNEESGSSNISSDFSMALNVVTDCNYLLKSHAVLDEVIDKLSLDVGYDTLSRSIRTSNPEKTRILNVTVTAGSPDEAKKIVDEVCQVGEKCITKAMGFRQVNLYEYGTLESKPCNPISKISGVMVGIAVMVLVYTIFLVLFIVDDRIRTDEEIEKYLGLTILGDIPNADAADGKHYGYRAYGKKTYGNKAHGNIDSTGGEK